MMDEEEWDLTVTWCIEDYSSCPLKTGEELFSPDFTVEALDNSRWSLSAFPGGWKEEDKEYLTCFLYKNEDSIFKEDSHIAYKLQISTAHKKVLQTFRECFIFKNGNGRGTPSIIKQEELVTELKDCSSDTLFVYCSIRRNCTSERLSLKKELRTRIVSQKCSFEWKVKFLKHPQNIKNKIYFSLEGQFYQISIAIPHNDVEITVQKLKKNVSSKLIIGKMALVDVNGCPVFSKRDTFSFDAELGKEVWEFPSFVTKTQLVDNATEFEKDWKIMLLCEFSLYEKEEESKAVSESNFHIFEKLLALSDNFRVLLSDKTHVDVKLLVENNVELHAHRSVLANRSPVFRAMFDREMMENRTGVVNIEDVDSKTLEFFLLFLYTGVVDDLESEIATKLLMVADKYEVPTLKEVCARFLMTALTLDNVCEILTIADMVRHEHLKNTCLDYAADYVTEIFSNPDFSKWVKDNPELCIKITLYSVETVKK